MQGEVMKKLLACLLTLALIFSCAACAKQEKAEGYTFTDDLGRTVTVDHPERVAALLASYADVWISAGGTICAAPDDAWEDYDFDLPEDAVNLGGTKSLSLESLLASRPDLVLASTNSSQHLEWQATLESAGIPTAYFNVSCFDDYLRMLRICADITGNEECYRRCGTEQKEKIEKILEQRGEPQKVLLLRASASYVRAKNHKNVMGEMLRDFGCINIADQNDSLLENLNIESILLENPDKIFIVETGDNEEGIRPCVESLFEENPLWQELDAVRNGQVYFMDKHLFNMKPNARWAEAYEVLAEILYEK